MDELTRNQVMRITKDYNDMVEVTFPEVKVVTLLIRKDKWNPELEKKIQAWLKEQIGE